MKRFVITLMMVFACGTCFALDGEFSQVKTDDLEQWGVTGTHGFTVGNVDVGLGGKYFKISDKPAQYNLGANARFTVLGGLFGEVDVSTYDTHDAAAIGAGYTIHEMLSVSGAYAREYDSSEFNRFLQGSSIDLLRLGANGKAEVRAVALEYGATYVLDYNNDDNRVDGYVRARVNLVEYKKMKMYLGTGFERVRFRDSQRTYLGVTF
jgi:hypothetical protein